MTAILALLTVATLSGVAYHLLTRNESSPVSTPAAEMTLAERKAALADRIGRSLAESSPERDRPILAPLRPAAEEDFLVQLAHRRLAEMDAQRAAGV